MCKKHLGRHELYFLPGKYGNKVISETFYTGGRVRNFGPGIHTRNCIYFMPGDFVKIKFDECSKRCLSILEEADEDQTRT